MKTIAQLQQANRETGYPANVRSAVRKMLHNYDNLIEEEP